MFFKILNEYILMDTKYYCLWWISNFMSLLKLNSVVLVLRWKSLWCANNVYFDNARLRLKRHHIYHYDFTIITIGISIKNTKIFIRMRQSNFKIVYFSYRFPVVMLVVTVTFWMYNSFKKIRNINVCLSKC